MALPLTPAAIAAAKQLGVIPLMVLEIDGIDELFTSAKVSHKIRIGEDGLYIGNDWVIGGLKESDGQSSYLTFGTGATTKITQKLDPSRAQGSSVTSMTISLVDANEEISEMVSPGFVVSDMLGRNVVIRQGVQGTAYPEDFTVIFRGVVQTIDAGAGFINLVLNNTEEKKRAAILPQTQTKTSSKVDYRSVTIQDIFYQNRDDVPNNITVQYLNTGTAGTEIVTLVGYNISVAMQAGVSTAAQIRKAIEEQGSNQLVTVKIVGDSSNVQAATSIVPLGSSTDIFLDNPDVLIDMPSRTDMKTLVIIDDEVIQYEEVNINNIATLTRAQANSLPALHDSAKDANQLVQLIGNPMDIALKLMLSLGPEYYLEDHEVTSINYIDVFTTVANSIFFQFEDLKDVYGVVLGDFLTITDSLIPGNNVVDSIIIDIDYTNDGMLITISDTLVDEPASPAKIKIKSQFNVWPIGCGMLPKEVDIDQHTYLRDTFLPIFPMKIYVKEISNAKDFIEQQIYLPCACFSVPRQGRSSVAYHKGPLATERVITLNASNVLNAPSLKVSRSTSQNFANVIDFAYDYNPVLDKCTTDGQFESEQSLVQIPVGEKPMDIEARGINTADSGAALVAMTANRLLRRYQFGAEYINGIQCHFGDGYGIEIGDIVIVDYGSLKLTDFSTGNRRGGLKLLECLNKVQDNKTGEITLDLVNTVYGIDDRFGLISPASLIGIGSTAVKAIVQKSWSTKSYSRESIKWKNYLGQQVLVHSPDWTVSGLTTLVSFDNNDPQGALFDPPLGFVPQEGYIMCCPNYPSTTDNRDLAFWKLRHAFFSWQLVVASGIDSTSFTLASAPAGIPFVGSTIRVHNYDYTNDSPEVKVLSIVGLVVTVDKDLGFVPDSTHMVDLIGFPDRGSAYRII